MEQPVERWQLDSPGPAPPPAVDVRDRGLLPTVPSGFDSAATCVRRLDRYPPRHRAPRGSAEPSLQFGRSPHLAPPVLMPHSTNGLLPGDLLALPKSSRPRQLLSGSCPAASKHGSHCLGTSRRRWRSLEE